MGGWAVGLNANNAILNSVDVVVGVELGNNKCSVHTLGDQHFFLTRH